MGIRGRDGDRFVVVQHLVSGRGADETEDPRQPDANAREKGDLCQKPDVITWSLAGTLATMIVAFLVLLIIYYLSIRTNKRVRSLRREPTRRQKPVPSYLEPLPAPATAGPRQTHAHAALPLPCAPSSSPEHLYENPDKVGEWKNLYVNEAYGGGDRLGSFSSGSSE
nr:uncharacterized protein LOC113811336 [Penaeus vannamei]